MFDTPAPSPADALADALRQVQGYHQRTKHHLTAYAHGPETLDWDAQPNPFRRWIGADAVPLPLANAATEPDAPWSAWAQPRPAQPFDRVHLGLLFELSLALAAWKRAGPDRWAVRINPSSGNLHPTEGWLWLHGLPDTDLALCDGLYHYAPHAHALERRAAFAPLARAALGKTARAWVALSSIHWREAWKYGERAFRYCQLDAGHAIGALRVAAALLGWRLVPVALPLPALAARLGLDRNADFGSAEREDADSLFELLPADAPARAGALPPERVATWFGQPNRLDAHPMYRWPVIEEVARASAWPVAPFGFAQGAGGADGTSQGEPHESALAERSRSQAQAPTPPTPQATALIRQRRSAQRFDARARMNLAQLWPLLAALAPEQAPFDTLPGAPAVHVLLFLHRVDGLVPGAYLLPRGPSGLERLRAALPAAMDWAAVPEAPPGVPLLRLAENPALAGTLRTLNCHQALGSDAMLGVALLAQWDDWCSADGLPAPHAYRQRLQEAGLIGQVLYLEAEAAGLAGTGIGCFFDDGLHQLIGLPHTPSGMDAQQGAALQSVYHFTIGQRVEDGRITSEPPYAHLLAPSPAT